GYFCHSWQPTLDDAALLNDATMLVAVTKINKDITSLARILNSANTNFASVSSSDTAVPIDIMTKNDGNTNYLFAVGMRPGTTTATFTVSAGTKAEVIGENRTLTITSGKFTDDFASYAVHLYKITNDVSGVKENVLQQMKVYPNPASENLMVEFSNLAAHVNYNIVGMLGRTVQSGTVATNGISVTQLAKGSYFILFQDTAGNMETRRFFKE
ncbi:MAG TPA: T9SS type A sorting domain-containing protein, partial [Bacteroidia bacterium]|nr:T9SS type A sorting domain-containing protein [Bacteroidia bacterium]